MGIRIDTTDVLMTLIDECSSPYNIKIITPYWEQYLYEFIEKTYPKNEPKPLDDGYHLNIRELNLRIDEQYIFPQKKDIILKYIDNVINDVKSWFQHPARAKMSIHLTRILLGLGKAERAKEMYNIFKQQSKIAIEQYAIWF